VASFIVPIAMVSLRSRERLAGGRHRNRAAARRQRPRGFLSWGGCTGGHVSVRGRDWYRADNRRWQA